MLAALLPRAIGVDEIVLDIVNRGIETDVDEGIAALFDAKVECIGSGYGFVELVLSELIALVLPLWALVLQAVDFLARLAVFVFPNHNVKILVVGIVEGVIEQ